jgi:aspartyl protease family protein
MGGETRRSGREIVLPAGPGGHFFGDGRINGRPVRFLVDTGATAIAMSQSEAERLGLPWRSGLRGMAHTANGPVPSTLVMLASVRLGEVEVFNVAAIVVPAAMDHVLLGNSFLERFQMRRENDVMRLEKKP